MLQQHLARYSRLAQGVYNAPRRGPRAFVLIICVVAFLIITTSFWISGPVPWETPRLLFAGPFATNHEDWRTRKPSASLIPPKIWQIMLPKGNLPKDWAPDPETLQDTLSWVTKNTDYAYTLVGGIGGDEIVKSRSANQPAIFELYDKLSNVGMKSDILRYLLLHAEGGVYADIDTTALKPIDFWVPQHMRDKARLIVGVEFDRRDGGAWAEIPHWVAFCQYTIAAAPGHPVFEKMVARVLLSLEDLSAAYNLPLDKLSPTSPEVMNSTGPAAWTEVVFEQLQENDPSIKKYKDLSFMTGPRLIGDILLLPIDAFGMGQRHSHSTNDGTIPEAALAKHHFHGSWRTET